MRNERWNWPAVLGSLLCAAGVLSYFLIVFRFAAWMPETRNWAAPNWLLVLIGLVLSAVGVRRARARPRGAGGRVLAWMTATVSVALAAAFAWILYVLPALPPVGGPALGTPAPDFAARAGDGRVVRLADFRGAPLLLVFYRGHW